MWLPAQAFAGGVFYNPLAPGKKPSGEILPVSALVGRVIYGRLVVAGILATVSIIRAGIIMGASSGNADKLESGKRALLFSIIGLIVTFLGFIVTNYIISGAAGIIPGLGGN